MVTQVWFRLRDKKYILSYVVVLRKYFKIFILQTNFMYRSIYLKPSLSAINILF